MISQTIGIYRSAYSGLSKETWLLSLVMLINRMGTMVVPFMTLYLRSIGYSVAQAGLVFGLFGIGAFTGSFFGGKLTDRIGFYPVQILTLIGGAMMFFLLGQMQNYVMICIFTWGLGFINEAFRPANSTAIAFYSKPENRTRSYALNRLALNLGWAAGIGIAGFIAKIDYHLLFWVDGGTNLIAAILIWLFVKPVNYKPAHKAEEHVAKTMSPYLDKTYLIFLVLTILFASCFFQLFTNLPVFFKEGLGFSEPFIGLLLAINGIIIALVEMVIVYKLENRHRHLVYVTIGVVLVGISFLMLNIPGMGPLLAFGMITLVTFGEIFALPFMNTYWIGRSQEVNRGQYAALYTMAWSLAQTLGPIGGAQLADKQGFNILWWAVGSLCLIVGVLFYKLIK